MDRLITIKSNRYGVELRLDPDAPFQELCDAAYTRFRESVKFFRGTEHMAICFSGRVLTDAEEGKMKWFDNCLIRLFSYGGHEFFKAG